MFDEVDGLVINGIRGRIHDPTLYDVMENVHVHHSDLEGTTNTII
jgi:hypothetical protein